MPPIAVILGALSGLVPTLLRLLGNFASVGSAVVVAVVTAIPPTISALAQMLDAIAKSALLSFLFGACVVGGLGFAYGLQYDAPLRERAERQAIRLANQRADAAIARVRADYEAKLAAVTAAAIRTAKRK